MSNPPLCLLPHLPLLGTRKPKLGGPSCGMATPTSGCAVLRAAQADMVLPPSLPASSAVSEPETLPHKLPPL